MQRNDQTADEGNRVRMADIHLRLGQLTAAVSHLVETNAKLADQVIELIAHSSTVNARMGYVEDTCRALRKVLHEGNGTASVLTRIHMLETTVGTTGAITRERTTGRYALLVAATTVLGGILSAALSQLWSYLRR